MTQALIETFVDGPDHLRRQHQVELERLFNKNQTLSRIRHEFTECKEFSFTNYLMKNAIPEEFGLDLLVQMALHKRTTLPTLAGILRRHYEAHADASQRTVDMIGKCIEAELVEWNPVSQQLIMVFTISDDVQADLDRFQFPLPMVVPPRRVRDNRDTGYFTSRNSIILRKNHHEDDVCLDHINRVNRVLFAIDHDTAHMIANRWKHLDRAKPGESSTDFQKRVKAFAKYDRTAKEVIDTILRHGNEFYLTHKYDKRGRVYCQGYHVNYQGAPWNKAVIELANREFVE